MFYDTACIKNKKNIYTKQNLNGSRQTSCTRGRGDHSPAVARFGIDNDRHVSQ